MNSQVTIELMELEARKKQLIEDAKVERDEMFQRIASLNEILGVPSRKEIPTGVVKFREYKKGEAEQAEPAEPPKRKRGRPRKNPDPSLEF